MYMQATISKKIMLLFSSYSNSVAKVKIQANSLHDVSELVLNWLYKSDSNLDDVIILARYALLHPIHLLIRL